jgi:hypothetical protein
MIRPCKFYKVGFMLLILMLVGCTTHIIRSSEFETLKSGTPLGGVKSKKFALKQFRDVRETSNPLWIDCKYNQLDQPPALVIRTMLKKELERNGHLCIDYSPEVKADFIIDGALYKHLGTMENNGRLIVAVKLTVNKFSNDKTIFVRKYEGQYSVSGISGSTKDLLSGAYLAMLKEIVTDEDLLEFLEK